MPVIDGRSNAGTAFALADTGYAMDLVLQSMNDMPQISIHFDATKTARNANDVLRVLDLPAGFELSNGQLELQAAEGATLTVSVGTYTLAGSALSSGTDVASSINCNGTAGGVSPAPGMAPVGGAYNAMTGCPLAPTNADRFIGVLFNNASAHAIFDLIFKAKDLRPSKMGPRDSASTLFANVGA